MTQYRMAAALHRAGSRTQRSPDDIATKPFWVDLLVEATSDGVPGAMLATLEPDTVTRWHSHPCGQVLYAISGVGLAQRDGGPIEELRAGDCIAFAPGERHWHGSAERSTFAYVRVQGMKDGSTVTWFEPLN